MDCDGAVGAEGLGAQHWHEQLQQDEAGSSAGRGCEHKASSTAGGQGGGVVGVIQLPRAY